MGVTSVAIQLTIVDLLSKGVDSIKNRLESLSHASKELQQDFDRMGKSFKYAMIAGIATKEILRGLKPAISVAGDLQAEMLGVQAELMGAGKNAQALNSELRAIKATAFAVQAWTPFDMTQIVALEKALIKAGASVEEVTGKTGAAAAAAALAVYENMDPVRTGEALIGIGTPFKITADKYMELADTISRAASASTVGAAEIAETAKYAAGPMASLGRSNREMLALSAVMAQVGVSGSMAGTSLKNFFLEATKHKMLRDAQGNLLPTLKIVAKLREMLKGKGDADQQSALKKLFGEQGMPVAIALLNEGKGSYEEIVRAMEQSASLQDKLNKSMEGFRNQFTSLKGTFKSTIADLFQPALPVLTSLIAKTNEFVASIGNASQQSDKVGKAVSGISLGAAATGTAATVLLGGAGLYYGRKVLTGAGGIKGLLKGAGGTAAGIAEGKAVEAATGVTPVFVTNWPANLGGSVNPAQTAAEMAKGAKTLFPTMGKIFTKIGSIAKTPLAAGIGKGALAAAGGWTIGSFLESSFIKGWWGEKLFDFLNPEKAKLLNQNTINVSLSVDKNGRMYAESNDPNSKINLKRGGFIDGR
jgi:TP901 family phage tail tape measure protein